jgi:6-pyruvoyltetrahydropterin/6-carboxytetrahydropterin synthase
LRRGLRKADPSPSLRSGSGWQVIKARGHDGRVFIEMILLTRKAEFSASHYYWNEAWSAEENERVFGKCANKNGHGHNYTVEVTVAGDVDATSGFVVDLKQLKDVMEREVVGVYDHRHLNKEVPEFGKAIPTTENIAIAVWKRLDGKIPGAKLHRVRVYEMPDLFADYYGEV